MLGFFGVWSEHTDGLGFEIKGGVNFTEKDLTISRLVVGVGDAGSGSSLLSAKALFLTGSYGTRISKEWTASPYLGLRITNLSRAGYTETTASEILTYPDIRDESLSATIGVGFSTKFIPEITSLASLGMEIDINHSVSDYSATGITTSNTFAFNSSIQKTRLIGTVSAFYNIDEDQRVTGSILYRQESFSASSSTAAVATFQIGFK